MTNSNYVRAAVVFLLTVGLGSSRAATPEVWPTQGWRTSTPEAQGLDSGSLVKALDFIRDRHIPIHSLLIERNGSIVLDAYFFPFADNELHDAASVTKSVTSTLVGIAIGEKKFSGLSQPILSLFAEETARNSDQRKSAMTLADLLSMTSGLDCHFDHGEITLLQMRQSSHWAQFMLDLPMVAQPGTTFEYCSGGMHLLSAAVSRVTGESDLEYARHELFAPLGITAAEWPQDSDGVSHGWGDLHLQPRDMAKLGYLWLHNGRWNDRQIVPRDYLNAATAVHSRAQWGEQYGYGIWVYPDRAPPLFEANGRGGQRISVIPSKNMVVVMTGGGFEPGDIGAFILKSLKSDTALPANPRDDARLAQAVSAALAPPPARAPDALPPLAGILSGKAYRLDENALGLQSIALTFQTPAEASVRIIFADGHVEQDTIGLDGVPRLTRTTSGRPVGLVGRWEKDAFKFDYDQISDINAFSLQLVPEGHDLALRIVQRAETGGLDITIRGHGPV